MARCKYLQSPAEKCADTIEASMRKSFREFAGEIGRLCGVHGITKETFANEIDMPVPTIYWKLKHPEHFNLKDLCKIKQKFKDFNLSL